MNTSSLISHRMFVASLTGGHRSPASPRGPTAQVSVEPVPPPSAGALEEKRRQETLSASALRQVLSLGANNVL